MFLSILDDFVTNNFVLTSTIDDSFDQSRETSSERPSANEMRRTKKNKKVEKIYNNMEKTFDF